MLKNENMFLLNSLQRSRKEREKGDTVFMHRWSLPADGSARPLLVTARYTVALGGGTYCRRNHRVERGTTDFIKTLLREDEYIFHRVYQWLAKHRVFLPD